MNFNPDIYNNGLNNNINQTYSQGQGNIFQASNGINSNGNNYINNQYPPTQNQNFNNNYMPNTQQDNLPLNRNIANINSNIYGTPSKNQNQNLNIYNNNTTNNKNSKVKELERKRIEDQKYLESNFPFGKIGAGAPLRDAIGNIITKRKPLISDNKLMNDDSSNINNILTDITQRISSGRQILNNNPIEPRYNSARNNITVRKFYFFLIHLIILILKI